MNRITSLSIAREVVSRAVPAGGRAIDATAGRGRDTLFLAQAVGPAGQVYAFDIQAEALASARLLLEQNQLLARVELIRAGHEAMNRFVLDPVHAVMFNLGYLPGGDKEIITKPDTTAKAFAAAQELLLPGGVITLTLYTGHPGGLAEALEVEALAEKLPQIDYDIVKCTYPNRGSSTPYLIVVQKR